VHPDYLVQERARRAYRDLLQHLSQIQLERRMWMTRAGEVDRWWRQRSKMGLVKEGNGWRIEGVGRERARIAYAGLCDGRVVYSIEEAYEPVPCETVSGSDGRASEHQS